MNLEKLKKELQSKKILILGFGKEGIDTFKFLRKLFPEKILGIADENQDVRFKFQNSGFKFQDKNIIWHLGKNYLKTLKDYDLIIKSPGISINLPEIKKAYKEKRITSQTEIFLENCQSKIIGITGTKGKGTCSSFIYQLLKKSGKKPILAGNIGKPTLSLLKTIKRDNIIILEMSSHQLFDLKKSPNIAVFLNIFPAHLDYYKNFQQYFDAKKSITLYQKRGPARLQPDYFVLTGNNVSRSGGDIIIYSKDYPDIEKLAKLSQAQKISFSLKTEKADCHVKNSYIVYKKKKLFKVNDNNLAKYLNFMPGIIIGKLFGIKTDLIQKAILKYKTMPHRIEFAGKKNGIKFYNDSLATVPEATIFAIEFLGENIGTLILGGFDSKLSYKRLARKISQTNIRNLIFLLPKKTKFPQITKKIYKEIQLFEKLTKKTKKRKFFFAQSMKEAINLSFKNTEENKICLLSPGAPSFGMFKDYKERGNLFKKYAKNQKN